MGIRLKYAAVLLNAVASCWSDGFHISGFTTPHLMNFQHWVTTVAVALQDELEAEVSQLLDAFPPVRHQLPEVTSVFRSNWGTNPLTMGSYFYPAVGSALSDIEGLARPVGGEGRPVLLFAGEATHPCHYGTAHGAFLTGEREADRLLALD